MAIKLFVVDDHPIFIDGILGLLKDTPDFEIMGTANNGQEFLDKIKNNQPDIVLMDINMPIMDGIQATIELKTKFPKVKVIALTMFNDIRFIKEMLEIGAKGYVLKNILKDELIKAILTVAEGKPFLDSAVQEKVISSMSSSDDEDIDDKETDEMVQNITSRELEILQLIALGLTSQDISQKLFISKNTVETHRKNLLAKLNVKNTASLLKFAYKKGLV
ncbi:MAG: response regulator transcription factor [Chitinophagales bacterium]|nr:response regulator transcription factor [Chitinophagales bacterium]MCZ2394740.1 response regulator transcription factor [Chitinophagales bacterium]